MPQYGDLVELVPYGVADGPAWRLLCRITQGEPIHYDGIVTLLEVEPLEPRPDKPEGQRFEPFYWPTMAMVVVGAPDVTVTPARSPRWRGILRGVRRFYRV